MKRIAIGYTLGATSMVGYFYYRWFRYVTKGH